MNLKYFFLFKGGQKLRRNSPKRLKYPLSESMNAWINLLHTDRANQVEKQWAEQNVVPKMEANGKKYIRNDTYMALKKSSVSPCIEHPITHKYNSFMFFFYFQQSLKKINYFPSSLLWLCWKGSVLNDGHHLRLHLLPWPSRKLLSADAAPPCKLCSSFGTGRNEILSD